MSARSLFKGGSVIARPENSPMKKLRVFNNSSTAVLRAFNLATAAPLAPLEESAPKSEEWLLLAPYGESIYRHKQPDGSFVVLRQCVTPEGAAKMVSAFNSWSGRLGRLFRGAPVYKGHPDADPVRYPDETRLGSVNKVEAREDGIHVLVSWNAKGLENRREGYLVYPSPGWDCEVQGDRIVPDVLFSVGMVNNPNIHNVVPWTNSATGDPYSTSCPQCGMPANGLTRGGANSIASCENGHQWKPARPVPQISFPSNPAMLRKLVVHRINQKQANQ